MGSKHEGVSCDGCDAPNFSGDRFKCLRCYDFDLCARCYAEGKKSSKKERNTHLPSHPMLCIMSQQDFERTYRDDPTHSWDRCRVVIFTCPVCGAQGLTREQLVEHVLRDHPSTPAPTPSNGSAPKKREEMSCPICVATDSFRIGGFSDGLFHLTDMAAHMNEYHTQNSPPVPYGSTVNARAANLNVVGTFAEFLRDEDVRRAILHNIPLVGDFDFDDAVPETVRRSVLSNTRVANGMFPNRRPGERTTNEGPAVDDDNPAQSTPAPRAASTARNMQSTGAARGGGTTATANNTPRFRLRRQNAEEAVRRPIMSPPSSYLQTLSENELMRMLRFPPTPHRGLPVFRSGEVMMSQLLSAQGPTGGSPTVRDLFDATVAQPTVARTVRPDGSRYTREMMRSILENARLGVQATISRQSQQAAIERSPAEGYASDESRDVMRGRQQPGRSERIGRTVQASRDVQFAASTAASVAVSLPVTESIAVSEPLLVEKAGKATLLLPTELQHSKSAKTEVVSSEDNTKKALRTKKSVKCDVIKKYRDGKGRQLAERPSRRKHEKPTAESNSKKPYADPLYSSYFESSVKTVEPLPVLKIFENPNTDDIWSKPSSIPDMKLSIGKDAPEVSGQNFPDGFGTVPTEDAVPPCLVFVVGRPIKCTYVPKHRHAEGSENSEAKQPKKNSIRQTLEKIRKLEMHKSIGGHNRSSVSKNSPGKFVESPLYVPNRKQGVASAPVTTDQEQGTSVSKTFPLPKDGVEKLQNAFKDPTMELLLGAPIARTKCGFKPFRMVPAQFSRKLVDTWLQQHTEEVVGLAYNSDTKLAELRSRLQAAMGREPDVDEAVDNFSIPPGLEEPMFQPSEGSDEDLLTKKCASFGVAVPLPPYYAIGPGNTNLVNSEEVPHGYWNSKRFLHNRRDVFLLKKSTVSPPEMALDSSDWRFVRQLLIGKRDAPASMFLLSHYHSKMFELMFRTNLQRAVWKCSRDTSKVIDKEQKGEQETAISEPEFVLSFEPGPVRAVSEMKELNVVPVLWNFLNLSGFVEM